MPSLVPDLVKRVQRLPKPARTSEALQAVFEAISNGIHAIYTRWKEEATFNGRVDVVVSTNRNRQNIWVSVRDNGIGLDQDNWDAFRTTDTGHKLAFGGKGVGRLLWLDCFSNIHVSSAYYSGSEMRERSFQFRLSNQEQIDEYVEKSIPGHMQSGTFIKFEGVRDNGYLRKFPTTSELVFQNVFSHFLPLFVGGKSPIVEVLCGDEVRVYPRDMNEHISRKEEVLGLSLEGVGEFRLMMLECSKAASASLGGNHFVHFIANERTVVSQKIDSKLGIGQFGDNKDRVFHACVYSSYLDRHVNQERTGFNFDDHLLDGIINDICMKQIEGFLADPLEEQSEKQRAEIEAIVQTYPSVSFGTPEELQQHIPTGENSPDAIYAHLARQRFRRDAKQAQAIRATFENLKGGVLSEESFYGAISQAVRVLGEAEKKSLAEYVIRRKAVLDFIGLLLERVRASDGDSSYQTEEILHNMICPMRIRTVGSELQIVPAASHELWVIDERLTFAQYFSSDRALKELSASIDSDDRADVLVFNTVHSLKDREEMSRVLLIEFKRPGRKNYKEDENPAHQVERYVRLLQSGAQVDIKGRPIKLAGHTIFQCFIVADIVGRLDEWTYSWERVPGTGARRYVARDGFTGSIELVGWDDLLADANSRNKAFFERAGISGKSIFSTE